MSMSIRSLGRAALAGALLLALLAAPAPAQDLVIRFFNVGQGDAALITSPEGKTALIDGGNADGLASYDLSQLHVDSLDLVVASHNHADHIGGLQDILRTAQVGAYMENGVAASTATYESVHAFLVARHIRYLAAVPRTIQLGSVALRILPMPTPDKSQNNSSVGVLVTYRGFTALFTGDAEGKERTFWEAHAELPRVAVLKVAHHGSVNGTDPTWIKATRPVVAVISVGKDNTYGHPSSKTLSTLERAGVQVYRTDRDGDITVAVDSLGGFTVRAETPEPTRSWPPSSYR
jgi:beta-lactamase superfamily II metal-dependent hydrolase